MTTTELIKILQNYEFGASGRPRNISFEIKTSKRSKYVYEPNIKISSTGDGICGAEICFEIEKNNED